MTAATDTVTLLREGIAAARAGDRPRTRTLFRQLIELEPANELAWLWLANATDEPADALSHLRRVLELNPSNGYATNALPDALVRAGAAATKAGDREGARALLAEATDRAPKNEAAWLWRAGATDDPTEAVGYLERVLDLNPKNERALQGLAHYRGVIGPQWACPLCGCGANKPAAVCPGCRAVLTLDDPAAFDRPTGADRTTLEQSAQRLYAVISADSTAAAAFYLGLTYLNLGYPEEGLKAVQSACKTKGADPGWKAAVARLVKHRQSEVGGCVSRRVQNEERQARKPTVLIVDDSATVRKLVNVTLSGAGYAVLEAADGYQVADVVRQHGVPRLFLLDVNMPGMDGFQLCKLLRQNPDTAKVPAVFLTGKDGFFNKLRGQWAGAAEYLTKPFDPQKLLTTVGKLVVEAGTRS